jgi:flagellar P-ring protein precursor FlgI
MFHRTTAFLCIVFVATGASFASKIADITRLGGQRPNGLAGIGLVYGLKGTGDGGNFAPAIRPLAQMLAKFSNQANIAELTNVQNVALVSVTATVPSNGARDGDRIDVYVTSIGAASSLKGGRLFFTPLQVAVPNGGIFAIAEGPVVLEDPSSPLVGVVKGGAVMEASLVMPMVENGRFSLIIDDSHASWTMASTIARIINDAGDDPAETIAVAVDPKQVIVTIPRSERERPDSFIARVQRLPIPMIPAEARVVINQRTGTIIMTGDVEISPVVISHKGLTISTMNPPTVPSPRTPVLESRETIALDTTGTGGAKLQDLVNALDALKVPSEDRISILRELHKTGKLHAKLVIE